MTATEQVILVDEDDNLIGTAEKMQAHRDNLCHRAFSVFIFRQNSQLEVLLQQRAAGKYHSPLLWTNTCCSHPRPGEEIIAAGERRLAEEMGIHTTLQWVDKFHYIAHFNNGLTENEVDHVLIGFYEKSFTPNPAEVAAYEWLSPETLNQKLIENPHQFTPWLSKAWAIASQAV